MSPLVLDYSDWRPSSANALKTLGVVGVARYIAPKAWAWPKAITPYEETVLQVAGLARAYVFEANTQDYLRGEARGAGQGMAARTAMQELGHGPEVPLYLAIDTDVPAANYGLALDYVRAFHQECGQVLLGLYAQGDLIELAVAAAGVTFGWQSESRSFPGNAAPTPHTVLRQNYGEQLTNFPGAYDENDVLALDWGQWPRPSTAPPPPPVIMPPAPHVIDLEEDAVKYGLVTLKPLGFGQFAGELDVGVPVKGCTVAVHGPDPHQIDPQSPDTLWPETIGATVRCQARGTKVVVTGSCPAATDTTLLAVHVTAYV